jgi:hypothetical protein
LAHKASARRLCRPTLFYLAPREKSTPARFIPCAAPPPGPYARRCATAAALRNVFKLKQNITLIKRLWVNGSTASFLKCE